MASTGRDLFCHQPDRVASRGEVRGLAGEILAWCLEQCGNVRIDTHDDNFPMQRALERCGYRYCGVIVIEDGSERLAYQKVK